MLNAEATGRSDPGALWPSPLQTQSSLCGFQKHQQSRGNTLLICGLNRDVSPGPDTAAIYTMRPLLPDLAIMSSSRAWQRTRRER